MIRDEPAPILDPGDEDLHSPGIKWTGEAMAVFTLAEFTVPHACSEAEEVERWLRAMRRDGVVGRALGDLGFLDGQLISRAEPPGNPLRTSAVGAMRAKAAALADQRHAASVTTVDMLFALLATHGDLVDRALYERRITRPSLLDHVAGGARALARLELEKQL